MPSKYTDTSSDLFLYFIEEMHLNLERLRYNELYIVKHGLKYNFSLYILFVQFIIANITALINELCKHLNEGSWL